MDLKTLNESVTRHKRRKRIGRGHGSGHGKTSGRGHKGQKSRSGGKVHPLFEGGQMPLGRRTPRRGFNNKWRKQVAIVNVESLNRFEDGSTVDQDALAEVRLVSGKYDLIKILGDGDLQKKLTVKVDRFSKSAIEKIEQAGGEAITA